MARLATISAVAVLMVSTLANAAEPIALRDMGSFQVDDIDEGNSQW